MWNVNYHFLHLLFFGKIILQKFLYMLSHVIKIVGQIAYLILSMLDYPSIQITFNYILGRVSKAFYRFSNTFIQPIRKQKSRNQHNQYKTCNQLAPGKLRFSLKLWYVSKKKYIQPAARGSKESYYHMETIFFKIPSAFLSFTGINRKFMTKLFVQFYIFPINQLISL